MSGYDDTRPGRYKPALHEGWRFFLPIFGTIGCIIIFDSFFGGHGRDVWELLVAIPAAAACIKALRRPAIPMEFMRWAKPRSPASFYLRARLAPVIGLIAISVFVAYHVIKLVHPE